jgi:hypothetical protein
LFLLLLSNSISSIAQVPVIQWQKSLGGMENEAVTSIQQTVDGGYIVAGTTLSDDQDVSGYHGATPASGLDCWIVKLSGTGSIQWEKCIGGTNDDWAFAVSQTADSGYIIAGNTFSSDGNFTFNHGGSDAMVVKLSAAGSIIWEKTLGGSSGDKASSIQQTLDGGYIVAGETSSDDGDVTGYHGHTGATPYGDYWVLKLSAAGGIEWENCYGTGNNDEAMCVRPTTDGGYIVAGTQADSVTGIDKYGVIKLSVTGNIEWQKRYGGTMGSQLATIRQTTDRGYILAGTSRADDGDVFGNHGQADYWIVKINDTGAIEWENSFGGSLDDYAFDIVQTQNGEYVVAGVTSSYSCDITTPHGGLDAWIVRLSPTGAILWQKSLGGSSDDGAMAIQQTSDKGFIVANYTNSYNGDITNSHGGLDYWIVKLSNTEDVVNIATNNSIALVLNPATDMIYIRGVGNIHIQIYNLLGQLVKETWDADSIPISDLPATTYIIKLYNKQGDLVYTSKVTKL